VQDAGINVQYPEGDGIVAVRDGIELTFDTETETRSFYEVELAYLERIRENPLHIIHNKFQDSYGYIGESASVEAAYGLVHSKPMVLLYPAQLIDTVPASIRTILTERSDKLYIASLDEMDADELTDYLGRVVEQRRIDYSLSVAEEFEFFSQLTILLAKYKQMQ
jgi:hypothetical protein